MQEKRFNLKPSKFFLSIFSILFLTSAVICFVLTISPWIKILLFSFVLIYGLRILWRHILLRSGESIRDICYQAEGEWQLTSNTTTTFASLKGDSIITSWISILRFKTNRFFPQSVILFRDSIEDYRQLIVLLRFHR